MSSVRNFFLFSVLCLSISCSKTQQHEIELVKNNEYNLKIMHIVPLSGHEEVISLYNIKNYIEGRRVVPDSVLGKLIFVKTNSVEGTEDSVAIQLDANEVDSLFLYSSQLLNELKLTNVDTAVNGNVLKPYTTDFGMVSVKIYKKPVSKEIQFFNLLSLD